MKQYADRLKEALECLDNTLEINDFSPKGIYIPGARSFGLVNKIQDYLTRFLSYPRQIEEIESDIFHIVDHANAYLASNLDMRKVVITCHDLMYLKQLKREIPLGYEDGFISWPAGRIFLWSCEYIPKASKLITVSNATKKDMVRLLGCRQEDISVIYHGIDSRFREIKDKDLLQILRNKLARGAKYALLNIGSKSSYKNFAGLLYALNILVKRYGRDVLLIRVGEVTKRHRRLMEKLNLGQYIKVLTDIPPDELNIIYNISDVFVFPSFYEGFGWPTIEAMACGLPIVSSDKGGLKEIVEDAAYIIDPYDAQNIARAIVNVLEDADKREELIIKGFERVKKFNNKDMASQTYQIYQQVNNAN